MLAAWSGHAPMPWRAPMTTANTTVSHCGVDSLIKYISTYTVPTMVQYLQANRTIMTRQPGAYGEGQHNTYAI